MSQKDDSLPKIVKFQLAKVLIFLLIAKKWLQNVILGYQFSTFISVAVFILHRQSFLPLTDTKVAKPHLNTKRSSGKPFGAVYRNSAALGIAQVNLALLSFARAFFLRWRVNSSKTFSYSSAWLESASGNGDKRLTK